jgi:hypothetical protein
LITASKLPIGPRSLALASLMAEVRQTRRRFGSVVAPWLGPRPHEPIDAECALEAMRSQSAPLVGPLVSYGRSVVVMFAALVGRQT